MFNFLRSFSQQKQQPPPQPVQAQPPKQNFYSTTPKLRDNFAEELLNLEMDVESDDVQMETITQLLNIYKEAVEYFEAIQSKKYLIFKNKIQTLFMKKQVMKAMKVNQKKTNPVDIKKQLKEIKQSDQKQCAGEMISVHEQQQEKLNTLINKDLQAQNSLIQERLQKRRSSQVRQQLGSPRIEQATEFNPNYTPLVKTPIRQQYRGRQTTDT